MRLALRTAFLAALAGLIVPTGALAANEQVFVASGQPQDFTVPANASQVTFTVEGAQGGSAQAASGAKVVATLPATSGEVFELIVGGGGSFGFDPFMGAGFNGGGPAPSGYGSGGGGGASDVRSGPCAASNSCGLSDRAIVAAGGGGADQCGYYDTGVGGQNGTVGGTQFDPPGGVTNYGFGGGGGRRRSVRRRGQRRRGRAHSAKRRGQAIHRLWRRRRWRRAVWGRRWWRWWRAGLGVHRAWWWRRWRQ